MSRALWLTSRISIKTSSCSSPLRALIFPRAYSLFAGANCFLDSLHLKGTHRGLFATSLTAPDGSACMYIPLDGLGSTAMASKHRSAISLEPRRIALSGADTAKHRVRITYLSVYSSIREKPSFRRLDRRYMQAVCSQLCCLDTEKSRLRPFECGGRILRRVAGLRQAP